MKYIIIGAGWYGCHIASYLLDKNKTIVIIDKENDFFNGSSSKNQNRLHLGFHYPRSSSTIIESKKGYIEFLHLYRSFTTHIPKNIYYISKINSRVSLNTFVNTMNQNNLNYTICNTAEAASPFILNNIEDTCIITDELYIDYRKAKTYFKDKLSEYMIHISNSEIFNSVESIKHYLDVKDSDIVINCTYNHLKPILYEKYEFFITFIYKIEYFDLFALTVMDGLYFSIYPYDISNNLYTITSVEYGVLYSGNDLKQPSHDIDDARCKVEMVLDTYIQNWKDYCTYVNYFTSWKTKPITLTDDRSVRIEHNGNEISIYGGKITGIFTAEKYISTIL